MVPAHANRHGKAGRYHTLDVTQARFAAEKAKVGLRQGENMKVEMAIFHNVLQRTGGDLEAVGDVAFPDRSEPPPVPSMIRRRNGPWLWEDLIEEFLDYKATKVEASYLPKYAKYLRHPGYECFMGCRSIASHLSGCSRSGTTSSRPFPCRLPRGA